MPNHIQNRIEAGATDMKAIRERLRSEAASVDFNRLIRMPAHDPGNFLADGGLSGDDTASVGSDLNTWYGWSRQFWGTKWNAYGCDDKRDTGNLLHFQTAWSCPHPILFALTAALPGTSFRWDYADEDFGSNYGRYDVQYGEIRKGKIDEPALIFAVKLHDRDEWSWMEYLPDNPKHGLLA